MPSWFRKNSSTSSITLLLLLIKITVRPINKKSNVFRYTCCWGSPWMILTYTSLRPWMNSSLGCIFSKNLLPSSSPKPRRCSRKSARQWWMKILVWGSQLSHKRIVWNRPFLSRLRYTKESSWDNNLQGGSTTASWWRRTKSRWTTRWSGSHRRKPKRLIITPLAALGFEHALTTPWFLITCIINQLTIYTKR